MLSRRRRRRAGTVLAGLLLYQSLFMAVGACAQSHDAGHAAGEHGTAEHSVHMASHDADMPLAIHSDVEPRADDRSDGHPASDGAMGCCAHHTPDARDPGTPAGLPDVAPQGPAPGGPDCTALSSCGTAVAIADLVTDRRLDTGPVRSALRPATLAPLAVDLSLTPPPPRA